MMPKLIRNELDPYFQYIAENDLIKSCREDKDIFYRTEWGEFAEKLLQNIDVLKALNTVYSRCQSQLLIKVILQQCADYGTENKKKHFPDIYKSKDEAGKLAKEIRRIKNSTKRLLNIIIEPGDTEIYNSAIKADHEDSKPNLLFPKILTDQQIMDSLDILAGAFDAWKERFSGNYLWRKEFTGIAFKLIKGQGPRKDWLECSFIYSMKRFFEDETGNPLTPVISVLRNSIYPEKKPINAERVRKMLKEIEEDKSIVRVKAKKLLFQGDANESA